MAFFKKSESNKHRYTWTAFLFQFKLFMQSAFVSDARLCNSARGAFESACNFFTLTPSLFHNTSQNVTAGPLPIQFPPLSSVPPVHINPPIYLFLLLHWLFSSIQSIPSVVMGIWKPDLTLCGNMGKHTHIHTHPPYHTNHRLVWWYGWKRRPYLGEPKFF